MRRIVVEGLIVETAPTVTELYAVLGPPTRVDSGESPAPVGHRNNQIHIYEDCGLTINEHHYTRRVQGLCCWFETDDPAFRFTPRHAFTGKLMFELVEMPRGGRDEEFVAVSPFRFVPGLGGVWTYKFDGFAVYLDARGAKLKSGRRSKVRRIVMVSVSWPHDNWSMPVEA
jgi:hypothetical protein